MTQGDLESHRFNRKVSLICLVIFFWVFLVFARGLWNDFVDYDDGGYFFANQHVLSGLKWENIKWAFSTFECSNWHPLTWLSLMFDAEVFGPGPMGPHLTNVVLHGLNAVLLFVLLYRLTGTHWPSAIVGLLFGLHPLHVESVAWISERKDVLSTFFGFLTLIFYSEYWRRLKGQAFGQKGFVGGGDSSIWYLAALISYALGLMSKPMLVTWPFVMLLLDYWPCGRVQALLKKAEENGASGAKGKKVGRIVAALWPLVSEKIPFIVLSIFSCIMTLFAQREAIELLEALPIGARLMNAVVSYVRYLGKAIWPFGLAVPYPHPNYWPFMVFFVALVVLLEFCVLVWLLARKHPFLVTGWLWYLGTLIPVIGIIQVGPQAMADRYTYVPLVGIFIIIAWGSEALLTRRPRLRTVSSAVAIVLLFGLSARTFDQIGYWKNTETLFKHAVSVTKGNYIAYYNLGHFYLRQNRLDEAIHYFKEAVAIRPKFDDALNNLGVALALKGDLEAAESYLRRAIELRPSKADVHFNLGNVLSKQGKLEAAVTAFEEAIRLRPNDAMAHNNLGLVLARLGRKEEAIRHLRLALELNPAMPGTREVLNQLEGPTESK